MDYTIEDIKDGIATVRYSDNSYAHLVLQDNMTQDDLDYLVYEFAPKTGSVPAFAAKGAKRTAKKKPPEDHSVPKMTKEEIDKFTNDNDWIQESCRDLRNNRLEETDWIVSKYAELGQSVTDVWKTYRQTLRDLPKTWDPKPVYNEELDYISFENINWPKKPDLPKWNKYKS